MKGRRREGGNYYCCGWLFSLAKQKFITIFWRNSMRGQGKKRIHLFRISVRWKCWDNWAPSSPVCKRRREKLKWAFLLLLQTLKYFCFFFLRVWFFWLCAIFFFCCLINPLHIRRDSDTIQQKKPLQVLKKRGRFCRDTHPHPLKKRQTKSLANTRVNFKDPSALGGEGRLCLKDLFFSGPIREKSGVHFEFGGKRPLAPKKEFLVFSEWEGEKSLFFKKAPFLLILLGISKCPEKFLFPPCWNNACLSFFFPISRRRIPTGYLPKCLWGPLFFFFKKKNLSKWPHGCVTLPSPPTHTHTHLPLPPLVCVNTHLETDARQSGTDAKNASEGTPSSTLMPLGTGRGGNQQVTRCNLLFFLYTWKMDVRSPSLPATHCDAVLSFLGAWEKDGKVGILFSRKKQPLSLFFFLQKSFLPDLPPKFSGTSAKQLLCNC